jgi:glycosyltransferase involved in cell wall biosynthesis
MRIAMIAPQDSICMINWANELQKRGHDLLYLSIFPLTKKIDVPFKQIPIRIKKTYCKFWLNTRVIKRILNEFRTEVVHSFYTTNYGVLAVRQHRFPVVITIAGSDVLVEPSRSFIFKYANKFVFKHAKILNPVSNQLAKIITDEYKIKKNIKLFPAGVDTSLFYSKQEPNKTPIRIISTRNFKPVYNHNLFVDCIPELLEKNSGLEISFLGEGSLLDDFKNKLKNLPQVKFLGWQLHEKLGYELRNSNIYISTSFSDGTSASLLEAMACGVFPIVSDIPANRDWIEDGKNGYLVPTNDSKYLLKKINDAIHNEKLRQKARKINQKIVDEKADLQLIVSRLESVYSELVSG